MADTTGGNGLEISQIATTFDIWKPQYADALQQVRGDQRLTEFKMLRALETLKPVAGDEFKYYVEDIIQDAVHIGTGGILTYSSVTGIGTFLLGAASPNNDFLLSSNVAPYSTTQAGLPNVEAGDRLAFASTSGDILFTVTGVSGSYPTATVTIKQSDLTQTFTSANYPAGTAINKLTQVMEEGGTMPTGYLKKPYQETCYMQIIGTAYSTTGTQMTNQDWFRKYPDGTGIDAYYIVGQKQVEYRHEVAMGNALMWERPTTNSILGPVRGEPMKTTEGHAVYGTRKGNNIPYVSGSFSVSLFDAMSKLVDTNMSPTRYFNGMLGFDLDTETTNVLKTFMEGNAVPAYIADRAEADLFGNNKGLAAEVNYRYYQKGYYTYCFTQMPTWNMKNSTGLPGYNKVGFGLYSPIGSMKDAKSTVDIPIMGMLYKQLGNYSRMVETWTVAGAGNVTKVTNQDINSLYMRSHIGALHVGGELWTVFNRS